MFLLFLLEGHFNIRKSKGKLSGPISKRRPLCMLDTSYEFLGNIFWARLKEAIPSTATERVIPPSTKLRRQFVERYSQPMVAPRGSSRHS